MSWMSLKAKIRDLLAGSIRRRLVVSIAVVHAVLMTLFVADLVHRQLVFLQGQSHTRAEGLARVLSVNSVSWVLADDVRGLSDVVRSLRSHPHLMYAMVVDARGQVLAHTDRDRIGYYVSDPLSMSILSGPPAQRTVVESARMVASSCCHMPRSTALSLPGLAMVTWARLPSREHRMRPGTSVKRPWRCSCLPRGHASLPAPRGRRADGRASPARHALHRAP